MSSESLEDQSFINLVVHYEDELTKIMNGASATEIFTTNTRSRLRNHKIINYRNGQWFLTEKAIEILLTI
jgi:hypothetical protein